VPAPTPEIAVIVSNPFQQNTLVVSLPGRQDCLVIDPGMQPHKILAYLEEANLTPAALLVTHGHSDHIAGIVPLKNAYPDCPIVIGRNDAIKLIDPNENLSAMFGLPLVTLPADVQLNDGDTYSAAGFDLLVREIPGHSLGHVVYIWKAGQPWLVFGGDVLFAGSIGRTDFPDGSFYNLAKGIREILYTLPDDTIVFPGHGPETTIGEERQHNPHVPGRNG